jgi:hypothetical protein
MPHNSSLKKEGSNGTNKHVGKIKKHMHKEKTFGTTAAKGGVDDKTTWKYARSERFPSEMKKKHTWWAMRTRLWMY